MFFYREQGDTRPQAELPRYATIAEAHDHEWYAAEAKREIAAEQAAERFWEEGTAAQHEQYRWEVEQDERRAWAGMAQSF